VTQIPLPKFFRVQQSFASHALPDVSGAVSDALDAATLADKVAAGQTVAVTSGSRGVNNIATIVGKVTEYVASLGAKPIVVPAMGSHGGATAPGQAAMLASFGIDEGSMNCPIVSSMDTVKVGTTRDGIDVHFDKVASEADHVIVINRVKPHTRLTGKIESGICKMLMIGLGKHRGAQTYHQAFPDFGYSLDPLVSQIIPMIAEKMPLTLGLAIVEDAFDQTALIEAILPDQLLAKEARLLATARQWMPKLPFDEAELLIVDQIGKEISGTGMDTNVIGRKHHDKFAGPDELPKIREIYVRSLTKKSAGNGCGIGIAEYCHTQFAQAIDHEIMRINCVTSGHATAGAVPIRFDCDRDLLHAVLSQVGRRATSDLKWMRISDTLHLSDVVCSEGYWDEAQGRSDLQILSQPSELNFDPRGDLIDQ
jgi:hypothetical protein